MIRRAANGPTEPKRAQHAYRLRFLTEKYHLDPADWAPGIVDAEFTGIPLVHKFVEAELGQEPTDHSNQDEEEETATIRVKVTKKPN